MTVSSPVSTEPEMPAAPDALDWYSHQPTVSAMRQALNLLTQCRGIATHLNDGTVFTDIETRFGVPTGQGQNLFNLLNGAYGSTQGTFQVSDFQTMVDRLG